VILRAIVINSAIQYIGHGGQYKRISFAVLLIDLDLDTTFTRIETRTVKKHYNTLRN